MTSLNFAKFGLFKFSATVFFGEIFLATGNPAHILHHFLLKNIFIISRWKSSITLNTNCFRNFKFCGQTPQDLSVTLNFNFLSEFEFFFYIYANLHNRSVTMNDKRDLKNIWGGEFKSTFRSFASSWTAKIICKDIKLCLWFLHDAKCQPLFWDGIIKTLGKRLFVCGGSGNWCMNSQ